MDLEFLMVPAPFSGRVAAITISSITTVVEVPIASADEVLQVSYLQILLCLMVIVREHSAIRYGIHSGGVG